MWLWLDYTLTFTHQLTSHISFFINLYSSDKKLRKQNKTINSVTPRPWRLETFKSVGRLQNYLNSCPICELTSLFNFFENIIIKTLNAWPNYSQGAPLQLFYVSIIWLALDVETLWCSRLKKIKVKKVLTRIQVENHKHRRVNESTHTSLFC